MKSFFAKFRRSQDLQISKEAKTNQLKVLPLYVKLCYGIGGPPLQITTNAMGFYISIFLLEVAMATPLTISIIQIIPRIYDAISDPIVGYCVNRTQSRFGKYKPWIFLSTPLYCVSFFFLFFVPKDLSEIEKAVFYTLAAVLLQSGLTGYHVPYSSMCMTLSSNPVDRDSLTSYRMFFETAGVLIGAGVFGTLATRHRVMNLDHNITVTQDMYDTEKRDYMFGSFAVIGICIVCGISVLLGTPEKDQVANSKDPYLISVKKVLSNKPYLLAMFTFMFTSLGVQTVQSNLALYLTHSLKKPKIVTLAIMVLLVCALAQIPLGSYLFKRFGKKKIYTIGLIAFFPVLTSLAFIPSNTPDYVIYIALIYTSFSTMVAMLLPWSMLPDVIDLFYITNGCRLEATFYSFYVFFNKFAVGFSLGISALILQAANYKAGERIQPEMVGKIIRFYIGTSGMVCFLVALIFLYFYPITTKVRLEIAEKILEMKSRKMSVSFQDSNEMIYETNSLTSPIANMNMTKEVPPKYQDSDIDKDSVIGHKKDTNISNRQYKCGVYMNGIEDDITRTSSTNTFVTIID